MSILVTGGAGYIGSHCVMELNSRGQDVVVVDSLVKGHRQAVSSGTFCQGDLRDGEFLDRVFTAHKIDAVVHFAASSLVGESMKMPKEYYDNNVGGAMSLLSAMLKHNIRKIVFSSTAATYGEPTRVPIEETDPQLPTNVYGDTKLTIEHMLKWFDSAYGINHVMLRYFNVAGAHSSGAIGEDHRPETHIIPLIFNIPLGKAETFSMYGDDYPTVDGTCIRDYIHVEDLINAHLLAIDYLAGGKSDVFNLGNQKGFSNREVLEIARKVTGHKIPSIVKERRPGDPATLIASCKKATDILGWKPEKSDLETIIASAWKWHSAHPNGYGD